MSTLKSLQQKRRTNLTDVKTRLDAISGDRKKTSKIEDPRFWKLTLDKEGKGSAIIRFLPPPPTDEQEIVHIQSYYFNGPGGYYAEKSRLLLGEPDPVMDYYRGQIQGGEDKENLRKFLPTKQWIANIYVVKDKEKPESEGKVFLFKFGNEIYKKILSVFPTDNESNDYDEPKFDPFDLENGADFLIVTEPKTRDPKGLRTYDKSKFRAPKALLADSIKNPQQLESAHEKIWEKTYSLLEFVSPESYKSYDELALKLNKVLFGSKENSIKISTSKTLDSLKSELTNELDETVELASEENSEFSPESLDKNFEDQDEDFDLEELQKQLEKL